MRRSGTGFCGFFTVRGFGLGRGLFYIKLACEVRSCMVSMRWVLLLVFSANWKLKMRKTSGALLEARRISGMSGVKLCASALAFARSTICSRNCIGVEVNDLMILKARIGSLTNGPGYKASPLAHRATQVDCILLLVRVLLLVTSVGSTSPAWVRLGSTCAEHMARSTAQHARPIHAGASTCRMACHIADTVERSSLE